MPRIQVRRSGLDAFWSCTLGKSRFESGNDALEIRLCLAIGKLATDYLCFVAMSFERRDASFRP